MKAGAKQTFLLFLMCVIQASASGSQLEGCPDAVKCIEEV